MTSDLLWRPTQEAIEQAQMTKFMRYIAQNTKQPIHTYSELFNYSITHPGDFWCYVRDFCGVVFTHPEKETIENYENTEHCRWFPGATLNFAEHLLRYRDDRTALEFINEQGTRQSYSYAQLFREVAQLASAMRALGITQGDRVIGYLPNIPYAVIAMLATTSLGAIWSSCSPDFGIEGALDRFLQITPKLLFSVDGYYYHDKFYSMQEKISALTAQLPSLLTTVVIPYGHDQPLFNNKVISYENFVDTEATSIHFESFPFSHPIYILYSSGTTGKPKCIVHSSGGTLLQHLKELVLHGNVTRKETIFYFTTCGWMMWNWLISALATGAKVVLYDGSPLMRQNAVLFDVIDKTGITIFGTSAKYLATIEKYALEPIKTHSLSHLTSILSTGSPLAPSQFDYVYRSIKKNLRLSSISGGSDIVSCFALGNPILPVYCGELQSIGLGLNVKVFNEQGVSVVEQKGELVCTAPFPAMPIGFWNDPEGTRYHQAYFARYPNVWTHGDYAAITSHQGLIIYGRSDATLNPGGIRIGTAEIYRQVEIFPEINESVVIAQEWQNDVRLVLFVTLTEGALLDETLKQRIRKQLRHNASPHHVPAKIIAVPDIPRTRNGKIAELAVSDTVHKREVTNKESLANPEALTYFSDLPELNN